MLDLVIIGAGPAGLSASIYAQRAALHTVTLESEGMGGGQIADAVEVDNYPGLLHTSGFDLSQALYSHAQELGSVFRNAMASRLQKQQSHWDVICSDGDVISAKAVIAASGTQQRKLQVPGETQYTGHGVSYCATCDGAFFKGKRVAVIGGGDTAVDDAIFLSDLAQQVYLIHRRDTLRANQRRQELMRTRKNVTLLWNTVVKEIQGEQQVQRIMLEHADGTQQVMEIDGIFVAVGSTPRTAYLPKRVLCDKAGYVLAGEDGSTRLPGLFVAGDMRAKMLRQVVTAVADGACCVHAAEQYIRSM